MKTRKIRHRGAIKILSCSGMKIVRYSFVVLCAIMLGGCSSSKQEPASSQEQESSWAQSFGVAKHSAIFAAANF